MPLTISAFVIITAALFFSSIRLSGVHLSTPANALVVLLAMMDRTIKAGFLLAARLTLPWNQGQLGFLPSSSMPNLLCQSISKSHSLYGARTASIRPCFVIS